MRSKHLVERERKRRKKKRRKRITLIVNKPWRLVMATCLAMMVIALALVVGSSTSSN